MKPASLLAFSFALLVGAPALADVLHLHNGRTMEGEVVRRWEGKVKLKVAGGTLVIPASTIARIEKKQTAHEEYADLARQTDMNNPVKVEQLSYWASKRGLGDQAEQLRALARGLRLHRRVDRIRGTRSGQDYMDIFFWAREKGYSDEVQGWLLDRAVEVEPDHAIARATIRNRERRRVARELAQQRRAEDRLAQEEEDRLREEREAEEERVAQLEDELARQREETEELEVRLNELEVQRRRRNRRRRRGRRNGGVIIIGIGGTPNGCNEYGPTVTFGPHVITPQQPSQCRTPRQVQRTGLFVKTR